MHRLLRRGLIIAGTGAALVGLGFAVPYLVPMGSYRGSIETAGSTATGRAMRIDGPVRLTLFPHLGLKAQQVTLANVPGGKASVMVNVGDIDLSLQLFPLLTGKIALDRITLVQPVIALEVDPSGNPNWQFAKPHATSKKGTLTLPSGTVFNGIDVADGTVTYDNAKTGTHRAIEHVNIKVAITTIDQPVALTGDLSIDARPIHFDGNLTTLKSFLGAGETKFALALDSDLMKADINGQMHPDGTTEGRFELASSSLRDLSNWLGQTKLPQGGLGALHLTSHIVNKDKVTRFEALKASLDGQTMTGTLSLDGSRTIPALAGALTFDRLNLNPYLGGGAVPSAAAPKTGWSRTPVSFALLKAFNANLTLSTGALTAQSLHLGPTELHLVIDQAVATATLDKVSLYGGNGQAVAMVDGRGPVPQFATRASFQAVSLHPFLKDMLRLETIDGNAALNLDIRFSGSTPDAMAHTLWGKGALTAQNGRVRGVDLGKVAKTVSVFLGHDATNAAAATEYHAMTASFTLAQGVLHTDNFALAGPVVEVSGRGGIDIGNKTIDMHVRPSAAVGGLHFGVPFRINGPWTKLSYAPDMDAIVGGAVDNLKNGAHMLEGLFGAQPQNNTPQNSGPKNGQKPKDSKGSGKSLKDLFGIH